MDFPYNERGMVQQFTPNFIYENVIKTKKEIDYDDTIYQYCNTSSIYCV